MKISVAPNEAKAVFKQCGMCSHTYYCLLNKEFGQKKPENELASDPLAGGILGQGHQCGMLWGASLAVGTESFRRQKDKDQAIAAAIEGTREVVESFRKTAGAINCREITGCDLTKPWGMITYMFKYLHHGMDKSLCFNIAEAWLPEAIVAAKAGMGRQCEKGNKTAMSCASLVAEKMGATDEEVVTVAGLAGGMGLSGEACGALAAAIWIDTLRWVRENPGKVPSYFRNSRAKQLIAAFKRETGGKMRCQDICKQEFKTVADHTEYIAHGGCAKLIASLT